MFKSNLENQNNNYNIRNQFVVKLDNKASKKSKIKMKYHEGKLQN